MTIEQAKSLGYGDRLTCSPPTTRKVVNVRVSGAPKVWKRSPDRVQVPVKYGLYESFYITEDNVADFGFA